jgi:hypothetical protein
MSAMHPQACRPATVLITAALAIGTVCRASAADHPNFTGSWVLDAARSTAMAPSADPVTVVVKHDDPVLRVSATVTPEIKDDRTYRTDGVERSVDVMGVPIAVRARWEGSKLVTRAVGAGTTTEETWQLLDGGKSLSIERKVSGMVSGAGYYFYRRR